MPDITTEDIRNLGGMFAALALGAYAFVRERMRSPAPVSMEMTQDMKHDLDRVEQAAKDIGAHVETLSSQVKFVMDNMDSVEPVITRMTAIETTIPKIETGLDQILKRIRQIGHRVNNMNMKVNYIVRVAPGIDKHVLDMIDSQVLDEEFK